jgi:hypothetical protein
MAYNSLTGLSLRVTDETIEVRGFGPFGRVLKLFGLRLTLPTRETTMFTASLRRLSIGLARFGSESEFVALSWTRGDNSSYTVAVRPADGDVDRLKNALRMAGVVGA